MQRKLIMKILSVNNTTDLYGASRCLERVFGQFVHDGHDVHAVLPGSGPLNTILEERGVRVHIQPSLSIFDRSKVGSIGGCLRFLLLFPVSVIQLLVLILRYRIDVVHTNTGVLPSSGVAAFLSGRPHIWHIRELFGEFGWLWKPYQRYMYLFSSAIVAISRCAHDQFDLALRNKVHVIYDGLNETLAEVNPLRRDVFRSALPAGKHLVGVMGRIKWHRKGQEVLVRAASLLKSRHPKTHYVLIGTAAQGNEDHEINLRALITSLGLDDDFTLVGETQDPISAFAALDIAVVPSVQPEPFGCVVIEAMAAGVPVVGSDCGGIAEQIVDGVSGLLFAPGNPQALANSLDLLFSDASLRKQMAVDGLRRVHTTFQLQTTCRQLLTLFDRVTRPEFNTTLGRNPL
jgi:glycosyltransferase involved in cell wall biosynthesis